MDEIIKDFLIPNTPFRGLILQGPFCLCAYIGVPEDHWIANMEDLTFRCHWGVTFSSLGGDGLRPEGWYWYGWDYGHAGDALTLPAEMEERMPPELLEFFAEYGSRNKKWTPEEIEHDIIDVAVDLLEALSSATGVTETFLHNFKQT